MSVFRAAWICPIVAPPIRRGWVAVRDGRIEALGRASDVPPEPIAQDLGSVAVLPGLVNAHTHLELSWLRDRVPPAGDFISWIQQLMLQRRGRIESADDPNVMSGIRGALSEARETGTVAIGDISNSLASVGPLREAGFDAVVFHELLGFKEVDGDLVERSRPLRAAAARAADGRVRVSIAPHAPYSVSSELFRAIRAEVRASDLPVSTIHLGESRSEMVLLRDGTGPWVDILRFLGVFPVDWQPPGTGPVEYLDGLGVLDDRTMAVHAVQLDNQGLRRLASLGSTIVTCPRSNQWVGEGVPPIARFYESGAAVAVGTDSLASVADLNLFSELATMRWLAPDIPARQLLESATLNGARALGLGDDLGSIEVGKRSDLIAVDIPGDVTDVEDHLVRGVDPRRIHWVAT